MRNLTYLMSVTVLAASNLATGCSDDAGADVAEAEPVGNAGTGGAAGSGGSGNVDDAGAAGNGGGTAGGAGMGSMAGAGGASMASRDAGLNLDASIGTDAGVDGGASVTLQSQFAPLFETVFNRCTFCHFDSYGGPNVDVAYMTVTTNLDDVVNRLNGVGDVMPQTCNDDDSCLTVEELAAIEAWVNAGTPR